MSLHSLAYSIWGTHIQALWVTQEATSHHCETKAQRRVSRYARASAAASGMRGQRYIRRRAPGVAVGALQGCACGVMAKPW